MIALRGTSESRWDSDAIIARVTTRSDRPVAVRGTEALLFMADVVEGSATQGFGAILRRGEHNILSEHSSTRPARDEILLPPQLLHLGDGDVIRFEPRTGHISVLYRRASTANTILFTEACNNYCVMCSQPPVRQPVDCTIEIWRQVIPLVDKHTAELGISGGEPTLFPDELLEMVRLCRNYLPGTALHILTNGRLFCYLTYAERLSALRHPDMMLGVPLYSDIDSQHDYIVQAKGAFEQTIKGLLNLGRVGIKVEIRAVIHKLNVDRLTQLAAFIARNLPFASHVALMGLEPTGFAKLNIKELWVDPHDYRATLTQTIQTLAQRRLNASIFNHQLCTVDQKVWEYARRSISDWKLEYLPACDSCAVKNNCCGFFASSLAVHSNHIKPFDSIAPARATN
ncbi:MAG: His-Xaa-Ser system radical SAM maturase HxsC [Bryobacteraceae bacterium]